MKRIAMAATLSVVASIASAETVLISPAFLNLRPGDFIESGKIWTVLHPSKPCPLPLAMAKNMRLSESFVGNMNGPRDRGCYATTLNHRIVRIESSGYEHADNLFNYAKAKVEKGGFTIIETRVNLQK